MYMKNMRKILLLLFIGGPLLSLSAQKDVPKWMNKAKNAVLTIETFKEDGTKLHTGTGFFISETGDAVSDYVLFEGADKAVVTDAAGNTMPVVLILGADDFYDVVKFKVDVPKKTAALSIASEAVQQGKPAYMLLYSKEKNPVFKKGTVKEVSKLKDSYNYYEIELPFESSFLSTPVLTAEGEVFGMIQADASGKDKTFAISPGYVNSLRVSSNDFFNRTYSSIGIRKAWPEDPDQALIALYLSASQDPKTYLETLNDFISTFPDYPDGYLNRASHYLFQRSALASTDAEQKKMLDLAKQDMNTAFKNNKKKGEAYYSQAKLIYNIAISDSTLEKDEWSVEKALSIVQKAIGEEDLPLYRHLEADINYSLGRYDKAYELYMSVNKSDMAAPATFYWAAKSRQNMPDADVNEVIVLIDSAVALGKTSGRPEEIGAYLLENVELKLQQERYKDVVADYDAYFDLMKGNVGAAFYFYREQAKFRLNDLEGALKDIEEAIRLNPNEADYYAEQASVYVRKRDYVKAEAAIRKALDIQPDYAACYRLLGVCHMRQNKKEEACAALNKAKELGDPVADKLVKENCGD